mmetsp:Transcript_7120/g.7465  ORF Transcript_7120/g.7465 Transcript_7120/m.7465 type:complete len:131 (+) Transcript_7120:1860-2252(+)
MPVSLLPHLNFHISNRTHFQDPKVQMVEAVYKADNISRDDILHTMNLYAQQFNNNQIHIGCGIHYKDMNQWKHAILKPSNQPMELFNPDNYAGHPNNDTIDMIHFYVFNYNADNNNVGFYRPAVGHHLHA